MLAGYFSTYGLQQIANKLKNAAALTAHTGWIVFPALSAFAFRSRWIVGLVFAAGSASSSIQIRLFWVSFGVGRNGDRLVRDAEARFPYGLGRDLLRRRSGHLLRGIGAVSAADGGSHCDPCLERNAAG